MSIKFFYLCEGVLVPIIFTKTNRDIAFSVDVDKGSPAEALGLAAMDQIVETLMDTGFNKTQLFYRQQPDGPDRVDRIQIDL